MEILLSDGTRLHGGIDCWEIQKRVTRTAKRDGAGGVAKGERYEEWMTFKWLSPNLSSAIRYVANMEVRTAHGIKEANRRIAALEKALEGFTDRATSSSA